MAGYSGTPLIKKLGIKPGHTLALIKAPDAFEQTLRLTDSVRVVRQLRRVADVIVFFTHQASELRRRIDALKAKLDPYGGLWIAWPKRASRVPTDMTETVVREVALAAGLVDNKVCAIDDVYSGLRLVVRVKDRPPRKRR